MSQFQTIEDHEKYKRTIYYKDKAHIIRHREDGPAVILEYHDKSWIKGWFKDGKLHREEGPAIEYSSGENYYYLNNIFLSKEKYLYELAKTRFGDFV